MKAMTRIATAVAGALVAGLMFVQPAAAGDNGKKYHGQRHHHHFKDHRHSRHHFKGHRHSRHHAFIPRKHGHRSHHAHRRPVFQFWYVPPPRRTIVVERYLSPPAISAVPPGAWVPSMTCREYTKDVIIHGRPAAAYGRACLQPDGSWQIMPD